MTTALSINGSRDLLLPGFKLTGTGIVADGQASFQNWDDLGQFLQRANGAVQWWIGDWLLLGEGRPEWGDRYEKTIEMFGVKYKTLSEYKSVASRFKIPDRSGNLPWSHHQVVAYEPPEVRRKLLTSAEPDAPNQKAKLSKSELKKEAKRLRRESHTPSLSNGQYVSRMLFIAARRRWREARSLVQSVMEATAV